MDSSNKVLLIVGPGRSGSTLIERIIGNQEGYFSVGEVRFFWEYFQDEFRLCGCGRKITECSFWHQVIQEILMEKTLDIERLIRISRKINRTGFLPVIMGYQSFYQSDVDELTNAYQMLYRRLFERSPSSILVDSSKIGTYAKLLMNVPGIDLRVLHLVRDSRAVAYSWKYRRKADPSSPDQDGLMRGRALLRSAIAWMVTNHYLLKMKPDLDFYTLLRYEDFAAKPTESIKQALAALDLLEIDRDLDIPFQLQPTHSIGGNPLRFNDRFMIKEDSSWRENMTDIQKYGLGVMTCSLLRTFNYSIADQKR